MKPIFHTATVLSLALLVGLSLLTPPSAKAQINYQGRLTDAAGATLPDGQYSISFSLWTAATGGSQIWGPFVADGGMTTGRGPLVDVVGGLNPNGGRFNVIIGGTDIAGASLTTAMAASASLYLQIQVSPGAAISPRQQILAAPRALRADVIPNVTPVGSHTNIAGSVGITSNLGIGGAAARRLHVTESNSIVGRFDSSNTGGTWLTLGNSSAGGQYWKLISTGSENGGGAGNLLFGSGPADGGGTSTPMGILANGNVGIGTLAPATKLQVTGAGFAFPATSGTTQSTGHVVRLQDSTNAILDIGGRGAFGFWLQCSDQLNLASNYPIALNPNGGNVGVGTTMPTRAKLDIVGGGANHVTNIGGFLNRNGAGDLSNSNQTRSFSIFADSVIAGSEIFAHSDARMKDIEKRSDGAADLATLSRIEVTDYTYIDKVTKGVGKQKKVIAQQVETLYPQAVSKSTDVVPDIFQRATVQDGWVQLATDLQKGERVRLIGEKEEAILEVLEVRDGGFRTAFQPTTDAIFVFGREVQDFRSVDYEAIAMLNVSATQELTRKLEAKSAEFTQLRAELTELRADKTTVTQKLAALEARDKAREARLTRLETALDAQPARTVSTTLHLK